MNCQWTVLHRLRNPKPKSRRERCGKPAGSRMVSAYHGPQRVWLCKFHWHLFSTRQKKPVDIPHGLLQDVETT